MSDPILRENEDALNSMQKDTSDFNLKEHTLYGEYDSVPVPEAKKQELNSILKDFNEMMGPTIKGLRHKSNMMEIQDHIYRKFLPWEMEFNTCMITSTRLQDSAYCADQLIKQLNGEGRLFVKDLLKEY